MTFEALRQTAAYKKHVVSGLDSRFLDGGGQPLPYGPNAPVAVRDASIPELVFVFKKQFRANAEQLNDCEEGRLAIEAWKTRIENQRK